jgi:D-amino-acid oxidase
MTPLIKLGNEVSEIELRIKQSLPPERFRPLEEAELKGNFENGWHIEVPLIETPVYLPYLFNSFLNNGGKISEREINSLDELIDEHSIVINCTGLGSRELANDDQLISIRGQIAFLKSENLKRIILEENAPTYIVYRTDGCICGGSYEENIYSTDTDSVTVQNIIDRCIELEPGLKKSAVIDCWAGLRPYRSEIRVERDSKKRLIHNYGHGGSGFTVSWGCADRVIQLLNEFT